jgi:antitoxin Phd
MKNIWHLKEAKDNFSKVILQALDNGPQFITKRGLEVAVIISCEKYYEMKKNKIKVSQFFQNSPLANLKIERDQSPVREEFVV